MTGAALSISWLALAIGVVGYILKRWWDNADTIMEHRRRAYSEYFSACYDLAREIMHHPEEASSETLNVAYESFQRRSPDFLLHASPTVLSISDEFYARFIALRDADRSQWHDDQKLELIGRLNQALSVLREVIKSELFLTQPRFQLERFLHRRRWSKMMAEEIEKDQSI